MDIFQKIASELQIKRGQVEATVKLIDEGNTIPFIARYRKEATGALNDEVLRNLFDRLNYLRGLEDRKETVLASIREQEKLTPELERQIREAETLVAVEDLYRPYKQKRRTRAVIAREKGYEPLAEMIFSQKSDSEISSCAEELAAEGESAQDALCGAKDILAEQFADDAGIRGSIRELTAKEGLLVTHADEKKQALDERSVYAQYYDSSEPVLKIPGHRILAVNRGEKEKILSVHIEAPEEKILRLMKKTVLSDARSPLAERLVCEAVEDSYRRLIAPSVENEVRAELTSRAEDGAIDVFGKNLKQLLMQPPIVGSTVLGWDPAYRTGCKLSVVDPTGKVLATKVIYPTPPQSKVEESEKILSEMIDRYHVDLISLGNGTASRESEQVIADLIPKLHRPVSYVIVNEAGASVYSASKLATEEFPNFDVGQRSATSMARRLQDPLAELVKIDPKSVGVGQYQHDMNQKKLNDALSAVVEDCVNSVGVDLNTASAPLLTYVSGISRPVAKNIVAYREKNGMFASRRDLLKVPKLGPKAFLQCAGFLRIRGGSQPLDNTAVHPESYEATERLLELTGHTSSDVAGGGIKTIASEVKSVADMAGSLGIGELTLRDILTELARPGRDPREDMPRPVLRSDVLEMKDLKEGMQLKGTVRNITDFGAFVDIGVHQDGLVHISHMTDHFIHHPLEAVSVGDVVDVTVLSVDLQKQRIALSMIGPVDEASGEKHVHEAGAAHRKDASLDGKNRTVREKQQSMQDRRDAGGRQKQQNRQGARRRQRDKAPQTEMARLIAQAMKKK